MTEHTSITLYSNQMLDAIWQRAREPQYADQVAVRSVAGHALTYRQLTTMVDDMAARLAVNGFQHGDRALLLVRPSIYTLLTVLAIIRAGGAVIIGNSAMGQATFADQMRRAAPRWVFAETLLVLLQKSRSVRQLLKRRGVQIPEIGSIANAQLVSVNAGLLPWLPLSHMSLRRISPGRSAEINTTQRADTDDLLLAFTSGTTGDPKAVVHTQRSVTATLLNIKDYLQLSDQDVFYAAALHLTIPALMVGATVVIPQRRFSAQQTVESCRRFGVTKTFEIPTQLQKTVDYLRKHNLRLPDTLDTMMLGAAPVLSDFLENLKPCLHERTQVWCAYGMSEILPVSAVSMAEKLTFDRRQGDLVGKPLPGVQVKFTPDGELVVAGNSLFDRYLGHGSVQRHYSGDVATMDADGRLILLGRKKDMIIRGNYNIYPGLIEPIIRQIDGVADCALVGVYDPAKADEEIILFVETAADTPHPDFAECLRQKLAVGEHSIDWYAQPDHILFANIPHAGRSLKVDKNGLRQLARKTLNIVEAAPTLEQTP